MRKDDYDYLLDLFKERKNFFDRTFQLIFPLPGLSLNDKIYMDNILKIIEIREQENEDTRNEFYAFNGISIVSCGLFIRHCMQIYLTRLLQYWRQRSIIC